MNTPQNFRDRFRTVCLAALATIAVSAQAGDSLTDKQAELYRALRPDAGPSDAPVTADTTELEAAILEYRAKANGLPPGYQLAVQESALDGIPEDGLPHSLRVARDIYVLQADVTVFAFRRVVDCVGSVDLEGAMQGIPQILCDD